MDAPEIIKTAAELLALKELTPRVLGPTADYFGEGLKSMAQKGVQNVARIFKNAEKYGRHNYDPSTGVAPRVVKAVLDEGYCCEDELEAEYLGGVLASAKGPVSRDDRALSYLAVLSSLSSYQIRTHCILYTSIINSERLSDMNVQRYLHRCGSEGHGITVCLKEADYVEAMEFSENEDPDQIAQHSFVGLEMKGLAQGGFEIVGKSKGADIPFRYFYPTVFGIELYIWGLGYGQKGVAALFDPNLPKSPISSNIKPFRMEYGHVGF